MRDYSIQEVRAVINIDLSRNELLTDFGKKTLDDRYCLEGEDYQDVFARAALAFCGGDLDLAQRLYDYSSKQWFMFATPLISNGGTSRGLPISCFLNYVDDSITGLTNNFVENAFLSTRGGGIGSYWGDIRSIGQKSSKGVETPGAISFMHTIDAQMLAYHQGSTRRGAAAVYMDISHPEIEDFINMRSPTGDVHRKNENLHHGVCIPDTFMRAVEQDADWKLFDPNSLEVTQTISARELWIKLLQTRVKSGEPYLYFVDTANKFLPQSQKDLGLRIHHSNLCTEITLPTSEDRTAVCCLSSINVSKYREFEYGMRHFVADLVRMLDNALSVFIESAPPEMYRAVRSATVERSIGLGTLGFHTLLQQESIPFDSVDAMVLNKELYKSIKMYALLETQELSYSRGEPSDMEGTGLRNAHLLAIAPNASSSIICGGVSPSVEPFAGNAFSQKTDSGTKKVCNPALYPVLEKYGKNDDGTWSSIIVNGGSVQHLDFLSNHEKEVFKTAYEIDQQSIIDLASSRQEYICQSQSVNLFMAGNINVKVLHKIHFDAWKQGLKSLYYLRSASVKSTETVTKTVENEIEKPKPKIECTENVCTMCEG